MRTERLDLKRVDGKLPVESKKSDKQTEAFWQKRPKAALDLEALAFEKAGHTMSNAECKLPPNTKQITKKGYRTVFVPAQVTRESPDGTHLSLTHSLHTHMQCACTCYEREREGVIR